MSTIQFDGNTYSISEFFNPTKTRIWAWSESPGKVKLSVYREAIKLFMNRHNIVTWFRALNESFGGISSDEYCNKFANIIEDIPEENLWVLWYFNIREITSTHIKFGHQMVRTTESLIQLNNSLGGRSLALPFDHSSWTTLTHQSFRTLVSEQSAKLTEYLNAIPQDTVIRTLDTIRYTSSLRNFFICFLCNHNSFSDPSGHEMFSPSVATSDLNCRVSFTSSDNDILQGYGFSVLYKFAETLDNRSRLYRTLQYSADPLKYISWPKILESEKNPVLYGVELETSYNCDIKEIIDAQEQLFFIVKSDGSVTGNKRYPGEFVTVPMSLKAHKKYWASWFSKLSYNDFDVSKNTNNGMHVHIDRKAFINDHHLKNMAWFYNVPCNRDFIMAISERDGKTEFCQPVIFSAGISKVKAYKSITQLAGNEKYRMVNLSKKNTVEVRIFKGIVSFAEIVKNLEFVDAVFQFCASERSINKLSVVDFIQWLNTECPSNKYSTLRLFINKMKRLDEHILKCELYNVIFSRTKDDDIVNALNASKLRITNEHISLLNRQGKGTRRFMLDKGTGKVVAWVKPGSKIAEYDRTLEQKFLFKKPAPITTISI